MMLRRRTARRANRARRFRLSGFLAVHPSSDSSFYSVRDIYSHSISDISSPKIRIYSRHHALEKHCTRLSTIKPYNIRFPGRRISAARGSTAGSAPRRPCRSPTRCCLACRVSFVRLVFDFGHFRADFWTISCYTFPTSPVSTFHTISFYFHLICQYFHQV